MVEYFQRGDEVTFRQGSAWGFGRYVGRFQSLSGTWFVLIEGQETTFMIPEANFKHNNQKKELHIDYKRGEL